MGRTCSNGRAMLEIYNRVDDGCQDRLGFSIPSLSAKDLMIEVSSSNSLFQLDVIKGHCSLWAALA